MPSPVFRKPPPPPLRPPLASLARAMGCRPSPSCMLTGRRLACAATSCWKQSVQPAPFQRCVLEGSRGLAGGPGKQGAGSGGQVCTLRAVSHWRGGCSRWWLCPRSLSCMHTDRLWHSVAGDLFSLTWHFRLSLPPPTFRALRTCCCFSCMQSSAPKLGRGVAKLPMAHSKPGCMLAPKPFFITFLLLRISLREMLLTHCMLLLFLHADPCAQGQGMALQRCPWPRLVQGSWQAFSPQTLNPENLSGFSA